MGRQQYICGFGVVRWSNRETGNSARINHEGVHLDLKKGLMSFEEFEDMLIGLNLMRDVTVEGRADSVVVHRYDETVPKKEKA